MNTKAILETQNPRCLLRVLRVFVSFVRGQWPRLACVSLLLVLGTSSSLAQTPQQRAADRIRVLQREAEALASQESQLLVELRKLEVERQLKVEELAGIEQQQKDT